MAHLEKVYAASFYDKKQSKPFYTTKIVAPSYHEADEIANEWADQKFPNRVVKVAIEKSRRGKEVVTR